MELKHNNNWVAFSHVMVALCTYPKLVSVEGEKICSLDVLGFKNFRVRRQVQRCHPINHIAGRPLADRLEEREREKKKSLDGRM